MAKKWFQLSEQGAGEKRLWLSLFLYKIFGEKILRIIAFFVSLSVFLTAKERRDASIKFFRHIGKPPIKSSFKQFINYGNALVDKILAFGGKLKSDDFEIDNNDAFCGSFFITTHIGNVEILRAMLDKPNAPRANIFLQTNMCETFNKFLKQMEIKVNLEVFPVENIDVETSIEISERIKNGEIVFIAGDRISAQNNNKTYEAEFLGKKVQFPLGTLRFALMLECPIYFAVCVKDKNASDKKFVVYTQKFNPTSNQKHAKLEELKHDYVAFLEKYTLKYPEQFFNFYDIFQ